ncbi:MAG: putative ABC transporter permease [Peptoniphilaceae bacterium]
MEFTGGYQLLWLFFIYSVAGWVTEVFLKFLEYKRFINRGFLIGPYCPIYGAGAVLITVGGKLLSPVDRTWAMSFLIAFVLCGLLEYLTSYILEKYFHARWWDYTERPMNLHGRVWIGNLILFGIGGVFILEEFNPRLLALAHRMGPRLFAAILTAVSILFVADAVMSYFIMNLLKQGVEKSRADKSEEIAAEVRYLLENRSVFHKRILDAYPELTFRTEMVKVRLERIRKEGEAIRLLAEEKVEAVEARAREAASKNLTPTRILQREIIEKQDVLIASLKEGADAKALEELEEAIRENKDILENRERRLRLMRAE